jgi:hypothetical protein
LAKILEKEPYYSSFSILLRKDFPFLEDVDTLLGYYRMTEEDCILCDKFISDF